MNWAYQAMLTVLTVALLLTVARLFGRRTAGVLAGLPTVTGPALIWLAMEFGADFAAQAAAGSVAACALCAVFALGYERTSRCVGPVLALVAASALATVLAAPAHAIRFHLDATLLLSIGLCLLVLALLPAGTRDTNPVRRLRGESWITAGVAGLVTAAAALAAPHVGAFWTGVLASPPLVMAAVAVHLQVVHGSSSTHSFLRGYVAGLVGRTLFGAVFSVAIATVGLGLTTLVATAAGCAVTLAVTHAMKPRQLKGGAAIAKDAR